MGIWFAVRGYIAGAAAFVACPCHLPLTLPILLTLTAGTAVGGWLANNATLIYVASAGLFIGGLLLAGKWLMTGETKACTVDAKEKRPTKLQNEV